MRLSGLPVNFTPMGNTHNHNDHPASVKTVNNPMITHADADVIRFALELCAAMGKRIVAECCDFLGNASLGLPFEGTELAQRRSRKLQSVSHGLCCNYRPKSFLIFSQGIVGSLRRFRASARSMRSSILSKSSRSSMGTTAATGFLRRCTTILSPPYAARLTMSEKFWRAVLAVNFGGMGIELPNFNVQIVRYHILYRVYTLCGLRE